MRTLIITDLHLNDKPRGLRAAQKKCILDIFHKENPDEIIIMGDVLMHRKPSPSDLLTLKEILDEFNKSSNVYILRGNHDSETKADDGVTALSLFEVLEGNKFVKVITHTWYDEENKRVFIPHYENEERIKEDLRSVPKGYDMFGHFGYNGCLNSAGDCDFGISPDCFNTTSFLGHIHRFVQKGNITILGTPYTTNFSESEKENYYAILDDGGPRTKKNTGWVSGEGETHTTELKLIDHGPRHLVVDYSDLESRLDFINDEKYFTVLRILVNKIGSSDSISNDLIDKLKVAQFEMQFKPIPDENLLSDYAPSRDLFSVNEAIIDDYLDNSHSEISKEDLLLGLRLLKE
jgi:predicted phosphodiesterase